VRYSDFDDVVKNYAQSYINRAKVELEYTKAIYSTKPSIVLTKEQHDSYVEYTEEQKNIINDRRIIIVE